MSLNQWQVAATRKIQTSFYGKAHGLLFDLAVISALAESTGPVCTEKKHRSLLGRCQPYPHSAT